MTHYSWNNELGFVASYDYHLNQSANMWCQNSNEDVVIFIEPPWVWLGLLGAMVAISGPLTSAYVSHLALNFLIPFCCIAYILYTCRVCKYTFVRDANGVSLTMIEKTPRREISHSSIKVIDLEISSSLQIDRRHALNEVDYFTITIDVLLENGNRIILRENSLDVSLVMTMNIVKSWLSTSYSHRELVQIATAVEHLSDPLDFQTTVIVLSPFVYPESEPSALVSPLSPLIHVSVSDSFTY
jgi:hypothetical protein